MKSFTEDLFITVLFANISCCILPTPKIVRHAKSIKKTFCRDKALVRTRFTYGRDFGLSDQEFNITD